MINIKCSIGKLEQLPNGKHIKPDGTEIYLYRGVYHRDNKPAIYNKRTGYAAYYKKGKLHNEKGPALINPKLNYIEYWINGVFIKREKYRP
jgi:hypothetical protein